MGGNLAYDWFSDPLLLYALSLAALLFGGIFILMLTIVFKHGRRLRSQRIQDYFVSLLNQAKQHLSEGKNIQPQITQINRLIQTHKVDIAYGWVRLLEKILPSERAQYIAITAKTNMLHCVPHCLNEGGIAEKCVAFEAIGLSGFDSFINDAKKYTKQGSIAPYACIALARLIGNDSLPLIVESYELGFLSTTQALSAIVEIPKDEVISYLNNQTDNVIPKNIFQYLMVN